MLPSYSRQLTRVVTLLSRQQQTSKGVSITVGKRQSSDFSWRTRENGELLPDYSSIQVKPGEVTLDQLRPSQQFLDSLTDEGKRVYERNCQELEIYLYMGQNIPDHLTDADWKQSMTLQTVYDRVTFWDYRAIKYFRERKDDYRAQFQQYKSNQVKKRFDEQVRQVEEGAMGYAPNAYQIIQNPFRSSADMNRYYGAKLLQAYLLDYPRIIVDLRALSNAEPKERSILSGHMEAMITHNKIATRPLPIDFCGVNPTPLMKDYIKKHMTYLDTAYHYQKLMPSLTDAPPEAMHGYDVKDIIYISKHAKEYLDGPLNAKAYVVCATMDYQRETLALARKSGIRAMALPIKKHVVWKHGSMDIPMPTIVKILRDVNQHGDWELAFKTSISRRHFEDVDERREIQLSIQREKNMEKRNLVATIEEYMAKKAKSSG